MYCVVGRKVGIFSSRTEDVFCISVLLETNLFGYLDMSFPKRHFQN